MSKSSELIYTSAPQGLRPGSRGFCSVVMSEIMPAGLIGPLESLSAYRHADGDGPSPINYMHVQMKVAGRPVNVLSRIAEAPPDYTGRTNKIAHHVVVATADQAPGGPAAVLRQSGFAIETWDGQVRKIPETKTIPSADSPLRIAHTWAAQSGDAGWAGTVASIFESRAPGPPLYLIYRPEQNAELLALIDEAICLLPESKRWNATFATYASELPPGVNCRLRCLIAGSPEALGLPPSAMTLDLASGNLDTPPPGPLVDAARSGRLAPPENVPPAGMPTPVGQPEIVVAANQPTSFEANEPTSNFLAPSMPAPGTPPLPAALPPSLEANSSSTRKYVWPLMAAALLMLCLGGAAMVYFLQTDSDDLLAELNAAAGIENPPKVDVPPKVQPEPDVELEPVPDMAATEAADGDAKEAERKKADATKRQSLEKLAKKILEGEAYVSDEDEKSITKFSDKVKEGLELLAEQNEQLNDLSIHPTEEQLAKWVRNEDGMNQLTSFIDARKGVVDALKEHPPLKDLQDHRERLTGEFKAWDDEAKKWEREQEKLPELIRQIPDSLTVEQMITNVLATANTHLQKSMPRLFDEYEKLSIENKQFAALIEKQFDPLQKELAADLKRRRDSHRLKIYFDGDVSRVVDKLQIKPRCYLTFDAEPLDAINRLKVDDTTPARFKKSNTVIDLPGRYQGWLEVGHLADGVTIRIRPRSIPQSIGKEYPVLEQLKVLADQQEKTITESGKPLRNLLDGKFGLIESSIDEKIKPLKNEKIEREKKKEEAAKKALSAEKTKEIEKLNEQIRKIEQEIADNEDAKAVLADFRGKETAIAKTLDELYLDQGERAIDAFELTQGHTSDQIVKDAIVRHVSNLKKLRRDYQNLKNNLTPFEMGGKLVFGKDSESSSEQSSTNFGQSSFEPVETFELFFFPELVYGPPPKE